MVSWGSLVGAAADSFDSSYRTGLARRGQELNEYRYGKPPDDEVQKEAGMGEGEGVVPVIENPSIDTTTTGSVSNSSSPITKDNIKQVEKYIFDAAESRGMDGATAVRVAKSEGLGVGIWQSNVQGKGGRETSYGPFQLLKNGGLGDKFKQVTGMDPSDPAGLYKQIDFALDEAKSSGWGQWYGAAKAGIGDWDGIGRGTAGSGQSPTAPDANQMADAEEPDKDKEEPDFTQPDTGGGEGGGGGGFEASPIPVPDPLQLSFNDWQQYAQPTKWDTTLMADEGGVIPGYDPTAKYEAYQQKVAAGPPGMMNTARVGGGSSFTPRKVGSASPTATASGPTESQLAFRELRKAQPAAATTTTAAPATNNTALRDLYAQRGSLMAQKQASSGSQNVGMQRSVARKWDTQISDIERQIAALTGGTTSYAEGGKVDKVKERTRQERTMSSRGDEGGQSARDRAVRRTNIEEKNLSSTALDSDGYWKKREASSKKDTPRHRANKGGGGGGKPAEPKPKGDTGFSPDLAVSPNRPDNRPATNAPTNNPPTNAPGPGGRLSPEYSPPPTLAKPAGTPRPQYPQVSGVPSGGTAQRVPASGTAERVPPSIDMMPTSATGGARPGLQPSRMQPSGSASGMPPSSSVTGMDVTNRPYTARNAAPTDRRPLGDLLSEIELLTPEEKEMLTRTINTGMTAGSSPMQQFRQQEVQGQRGGQRPIGEQMGEVNAFPDGVLETGMSAGSSPTQDFRQQEVQGQRGGQRSIQDLLGEIDALPDWMKKDLITNLTAPSQSPRAGYAEGGVIPERPESPMVSQRALSANYQRPQRRPLAPSAQPEGAQGPEGPEEPDIEPTPRLLADVGKALDGGIRFLTRTFGLDGGGGVVDTPDSPQMRNTGVRRMMSGEGRASPEEMNKAYDRVDPERRMTEGQRYMTTLAKTMQWYLRAGRKDDAESAAASMMLYAADRFGKIGSMASAAYRQYQKTGDPQALDDTVGYLEKAYEMIPDGGDFDVISLDPQSGELVTVHRGADGEEQQFNIRPDQIPMLLKQVQSGSSFWQQVGALADPEGTRQREKFRFELGQEERRDKRERAKEGRTKDWWYEQHGVERTEKQADEKTKRDQTLADTAAARELEVLDAKTKRGEVLSDAELKRRQELEDQARTRTNQVEDRDLKRTQELDDEKRERVQELENKIINETYLRGRPPKKGSLDLNLINPLLKKYLEASGKKDQALMDQSGTELVDALMAQGAGLKWLTDQGIWPDSNFTYLGAGSTPPADHPDAQQGVDPDGNPGWYIPDPARPGKMMLVPEE